MNMSLWQMTSKNFFNKWKKLLRRTGEEKELQILWDQTVILGPDIPEENVNLWVWQECVANGAVRKLKLVLYAEFKILSALMHEIYVSCSATWLNAVWRNKTLTVFYFVCKCQSVLLVFFKRTKKNPQM